MWWILSLPALGGGWGASATFVGFDSQTQNIYDWYVCQSQAVFLGTEVGRTCLPGGMEQEIEIRVDRVFKGTLPAVVKARESTMCPRTYTDAQGQPRILAAEARNPVVLAPDSVFFLLSSEGPEHLTAGFPEAYLIKTQTDHGYVARISTVQLPTYVIDLTTIPLTQVTQDDRPAKLERDEDSLSPGPTSAETATSLVDLNPLALAAPWETVLNQLEVVAKRQIPTCGTGVVYRESSGGKTP